MKPGEIVANLDTIHYLLRSSTQSILHAHTYLTEGPNEPTEDDYHALYTIYDYQTDLLKQLRDCIDELAKSSGRLLWLERNAHDSLIAGEKA